TVLEMGNDLLPRIARLAQVYPDAEVLARFPNTVAIAADVGPTLRAMLGQQPARPAQRQGWVAPLHDAYLAASKPTAVKSHGALDLAAAVAETARAAGEDVVMVTDGGSFARWVHRFRRVRRPGSMLGPAAGAMGYAVPGANGAALARPGTRVIAWAGDGGFMMTGQELATARALDLPVLVIVCDNAAQGSILAGQRRQFGPDADYGTRLTSPDFA